MDWSDSGRTESQPFAAERHVVRERLDPTHCCHQHYKEVVIQRDWRDEGAPLAAGACAMDRAWLAARGINTTL
jgi:hypothetical protein